MGLVIMLIWVVVAAIGGWKRRPELF